MKTHAPKDIQALSVEIEAKKAEIEVINVDIERAQAAVAEADRLDQDLEALTRKRAEHRALAFVAGKPADMAELDSQLEALERSSRSVREDGTAAALAIAMLEVKRADVEATTAALQEKRKQAIIDWLKERREKAIDRYMDLINSLGPILAEAAGADMLSQKISLLPSSRQEAGTWLLNEIKNGAIPFPFSRGKQMRYGLLSPFEWLRDPDLVERELQKFSSKLAAAGFEI